MRISLRTTGKLPAEMSRTLCGALRGSARYLAPRGAKAALSAALLAMSVSACSQTSGGAADTETARLYRRQCAACHGQGGEGGQVGQLKVADLRAPHAVAYTQEQLYRKIYEGGNGMPPFKYSLSDQQMHDLARFIRDEFQKDVKK